MSSEWDRRMTLRPSDPRADLRIPDALDATAHHRGTGNRLSTRGTAQPAMATCGPCAEPNPLAGEDDENIRRAHGHDLEPPTPGLGDGPHESLDGKDHEPAAHVFGDTAGDPVKSPKKAWETPVLRAHGYKPASEPGGTGRLTKEARERLEASTCIGTICGTRQVLDGSRQAGRSIMFNRCWGTRTSTYLNATANGLEDSMRRFDEQRGLLQSVRD
jgi:hypothetical protein